MENIMLAYKKKNIIIVSLLGHMECLGFLLEIFKEDNITILIANNTDKFKWIEYLITLFPNIIVENINNSEKIFKKKHDKIIKLTSTDNFPYSEKTLSILHINSHKIINQNYIVLTPYISGRQIFYTFPIFKPILHFSDNKIVTLIGYYLNTNIDKDTDSFIKKNNNYTFIFIIWGDKNYSNLLKHSNVKVLFNIKTTQLVSIINSSRYILSKKYINYDRFSGQLGLAMSFEKPLIIDKKTANTYSLPGIIFDKNYNNIDKLDDITDDKYNDIVKQIRLFNDQTLENNKTIINKLM